MKIFNVPNFLTLTRLVISPLMLPVLLVYLLPLNLFWLNSVLAILFGIFSLTDFFDGYLARKYQQETMLGRILDPIADKFLFYSVLIALLAGNKIFFYWVIVLIGREIFIMGLRQIALENNLSVPVSFLGKIKTAIQMVCLAFIIINPYQDRGYFGQFGMWNLLEKTLLFATLVLSLLSAKIYYDAFIKEFRTKQQRISSPEQKLF